MATRRRDGYRSGWPAVDWPLGRKRAVADNTAHQPMSAPCGDAVDEVGSPGCCLALGEVAQLVGHCCPGRIGRVLATVEAVTTTTPLPVLGGASSRTCLHVSGPVPLHQHAATLYLFEAECVVVRLNHDIDDRRRARTVVELTRWLTQREFPSVAPVDVEQPLDIHDYTVTFWRYYPQDNRPKPTAGHL